MVSPNIHVVLIGPGGVGSTVLQLLHQWNHSSLNVDMVMDSTHVCFDSNAIHTWSTQLSTNTSSQLEKQASSVSFKTISTPYHMNVHQDLLSLCPLVFSSIDPKVMIDCTASDRLPSKYYLSWLEQGYFIVTANKKGLVSEDLTFSSLLFTKYASQFFYESTVGAGLPVISTLLDLIATQDPLDRIEGVLSGSLSFLFNQCTSFPTHSFSDLVLQAKQLGFTEPDPREDLNGVDVARKLIILARTAGWNGLTLSQVSIQSLIPPSLKQVSLTHFLQHLTELDTFMAPYLKNSNSNETVPRYVGILDFTTKEAMVGIKEYPKNHSFVNLSSSDNCIQFITQRFPNGLVIQGAGAGNHVTAFGILSDLLKIYRRYV